MTYDNETDEPYLQNRIDDLEEELELYKLFLTSMMINKGVTWIKIPSDAMEDMKALRSKDLAQITKQGEFYVAAPHNDDS